MFGLMIALSALAGAALTVIVFENRVGRYLGVLARIDSIPTRHPVVRGGASRPCFIGGAVPLRAQFERSPVAME